MGPGLLKAKPDALLQVMVQASETGDSYKALFIGRLLTKLRPGVDALWEARTQLAESLGLHAEAAAAMKRRDQPNILPGIRFPRPRSLHDWAAAMAMLADDTAQVEGTGALLAVQAGVSGVTSAGTQAYARSIRVEDVLPNAFSLRAAVPMQKIKTRGLGLGALLGLAATAYGSYTGQADIAQAGQQLAESDGAAVDAASLEFDRKPAKIEGGSFVARVYQEGTARDERRAPSPAGEYAAVDFPISLPWAADAASKGVVLATVATTKGLDHADDAFKVDASEKGLNRFRTVRSGKEPWSKLTAKAPRGPVRVPAFLRLCQLGVADGWSGRGAPPMVCRKDGYFAPTTLLELMFTPEEHQLLFPWVPDTPRFQLEDLYSNGTLGLADANEWVFDQRENAYLIQPGAHAWLVPSSRSQQQ